MDENSHGLKTLKWVKNPIFSSRLKNNVRLTEIFQKRAVNSYFQKWLKCRKSAFDPFFKYI